MKKQKNKSEYPRACFGCVCELNVSSGPGVRAVCRQTSSTVI